MYTLLPQPAAADRRRQFLSKMPSRITPYVSTLRGSPKQPSSDQRPEDRRTSLMIDRQQPLRLGQGHTEPRQFRGPGLNSPCQLLKRFRLGLIGGRVFVIIRPPHSSSSALRPSRCMTDDASSELGRAVMDSKAVSVTLDGPGTASTGHRPRRSTPATVDVITIRSSLARCGSPITTRSAFRAVASATIALCGMPDTTSVSTSPQFSVSRGTSALSSFLTFSTDARCYRRSVEVHVIRNRRFRQETLRARGAVSRDRRSVEPGSALCSRRGVTSVGNQFHIRCC